MLIQLPGVSNVFVNPEMIVSAVDKRNGTVGLEMAHGGQMNAKGTVAEVVTQLNKAEAAERRKQHL